MKQRVSNPVIPDYRPKSKGEGQTVTPLALKPCLECHQPIERGYYGGHEGGGTCSAKCEAAYALKPKEYIDDNGTRH